MQHGRRGALAVVAALAVAALTACTGGGDGGRASATVTVTGPFTGDRAAALQQDLTRWGADRGIRVRYSGTGDVAAAVAERKPSIALAARPGDVPVLADAGALPLERLLDVSAATADVPAGLRDAGRSGDRTYALPMDVAVTSVVWYDPAAFERAALDVPETDGVLRRISGYVVGEDSGFPWCEGTEAGDATGRTLVDWLGEYVLRYGGATQYRQWVRHEIPFDAPIARRAAQKVYGLLLKPQQVDGGGVAIASTPESEAGTALFAETKAAGECFMLHQQSATERGYPEAIAARIASQGADSVGAFPLPIPDGATRSASGSADLVTAFDDDAATKAVVAYLTGPDFGAHGYSKAWPVTVSPHRGASLPASASPLQRASAEALRGAEVFGFDASSQLPAGTIAGSELTKWARQLKTIDAALKAVERAWPTG